MEYLNVLSVSMSLPYLAEVSVSKRSSSLSMEEDNETPYTRELPQATAIIQSHLIRNQS